jgi:hypothetical protein
VGRGYPQGATGAEKPRPGVSRQLYAKRIIQLLVIPRDTQPRPLRAFGLPGCVRSRPVWHSPGAAYPARKENSRPGVKAARTEVSRYQASSDNWSASYRERLGKGMDDGSARCIGNREIVDKGVRDC